MNLSPERRARVLAAVTAAALLSCMGPSAVRAEEPAPLSCPGAEGSSGTATGDGIAPVTARMKALARVPGRAARTVRLAPIDEAALRREDTEQRAELGRDWKRWNRVGVVRDLRPVVVPPTPSRWGRAETLADGSRVFRVTVAAPGATGLRLRLRECALPKGSELTVHDADQPEESYGPLDVPADARDWLTPTVFGERAVLALRVPAERLDDRVRLVVDGVSQRYRPPEELTGDGPGDASGPSKERASGLSCMNNVACDPSWAGDVARGVARFEFTTGGNTYLCSGTLLNDLDANTTIPWFLTANHCISTDKAAKTMEIFWDYRASTCSGSPPDLYTVPRTLGATLVATSGDTDCTLVRITGQLPTNRFYCGWNAARPAAGIDIVGVHHPEGSHMRISYGLLDTSSAHFHTVVWSDGVTAQGSSGSALFNEQKQVIGQLCCGSSYCNRPRDPDDYGRFDVSYPKILSASLGQTSTPAGPDAWDPGDDTASGATDLGAPSLDGTSHGPHTLNGSDAADWFRLDLTAGTPYVFESGDAVAGTLYSDVSGATTVVAETGGVTGMSILAVPLTTGSHWLRIRRAVPGEDTSYDLSLQRQDVIPPKAVGKLRAAQKSGQVTLTWTDRARDEFGYRVEFLGTAGWVRVGELPANSKRFRHRPGPGNQVYRVGPYDAVSTNWRETAVKVKGRPGLDDWDPADDTGAGATPLARTSPSETSVHELDRNDAADWFRIDLVQGETWSFETVSDGDTVGGIFRDAGGLEPVEDGDDQEDGSGAIVDYDFRMVFTAPETRTYWLQVRAFPSTPRATYTLRLALE